MWKALEINLGESVEGFDFSALAERAAAQRSRVESMHREAATAALGQI
jgi:hypothetical protein